jgi:two-component system sensor histidine kinase CpxA
LKTRFPLFAKLLLWFFVNLLILIAGVAVMLRVQFGSLDNWLLPQSSQDEIQAMSLELIDDLAHSDRGTWTDALKKISLDNKMDFALFDSHGRWMAGAPLAPPGQVQRAMIFAQPLHPRPRDDASAYRGPPASAASAPLGGEAPVRLPPSGPTQVRPDRGAAPEFPKSVIRTHDPTRYWLLIRLPPEPLGAVSPVTLAGVVSSLGRTPLLFNPKPWVVVVAAIIIFSTLFWLPLARGLSRSISTMTHATESIAEGRFDIQLANSRKDELGRLGHAINRMAGRLQEFVTGQKRFLGDAAHELCSPLARMEIALGILEERGDEAVLPYVRDVREELTHMRKLANELLSFSRASLGDGRVRLESVNVAGIVAAVLQLEKGDLRRIRVEVPGDLDVRGHPESLRRALANLLRNARTHAAGNGWISIAAWAEQNHVIITVSDEGPGVAPHELEKLFEPFYRVDPSRASETGGVGLGLAIVKTCVEACGGVVAAANRSPTGLEIRLRLDRAET